MEIKELISNKQGTIVDVRTKEEYMSGNVAGSIHVPLNEIETRINELRTVKQPLILCCASGGRSGQAQRYLALQGITCYNAGSWSDVIEYQSLMK